MSTDDIKFLLSVVLSADNFIADMHGKISFASAADQALLRALMVGNECDCFIVGRKTFAGMPGKIAKPYLVLSHDYMHYQNLGNILYTNTDNLQYILKKHRLQRPLILGGAAIYSYFLRGNFNIETRMTKEENVMLYKGIPWQKLSLGEIVEQHKIADHTTLIRYRNYHDIP